MAENKTELYSTVGRFFKKTAHDGIWEFNYEEVRRRAYLKWEAAGKPEGRDTDFWFDAESEVSEMAREIWSIWYTDP